MRSNLQVLASSAILFLSSTFFAPPRPVTNQTLQVRLRTSRHLSSTSRFVLGPRATLAVVSRSKSSPLQSLASRSVLHKRVPGSATSPHALSTWPTRRCHGWSNARERFIPRPSTLPMPNFTKVPALLKKLRECPNSRPRLSGPPPLERTPSGEKQTIDLFSFPIHTATKCSWS